MYTITIDCGTSFLKAALVEYETGKIIKKITKRTSEIETKNRFPRILNIPVRQHRKSGRRETVCPGLRKPLMRVYSRNVLSKP